MSEVHPGAARHESCDIAPSNASKWLSMMATPAFAIMALLNAVHDGGQANVLCSATPESLAGKAENLTLRSRFA